MVEREEKKGLQINRLADRLVALGITEAKSQQPKEALRMKENS